MRCRKQIIFCCVLLLLCCSCSNVSIESGRTPDWYLEYGIGRNNIEKLQYGLDHGANINYLKHNVIGEKNPLQIVLNDNSDSRLFYYLLEQGADPNEKDLFLRCVHNVNVGYCRALLEHGADVNAVWSNVRYPNALTCAVFHDQLGGIDEKDVEELVALLLEYGAKVDPPVLEAALYAQQERPKWIAYRVQQIVLQELLRNGYESNLSPLLEAAMLGDSEGTVALLQSGEWPNREEEDHFLSLVAAFGSPEALRLLQSGGIDLTKGAYYPLVHIAAYYGNQQTYDYLKDGSIEYTKKDTVYETAGYYALQNQQLHIFRDWLENGTEAMRKKWNIWDLIRTAQFGNAELLDMLLQTGYDFFPKEKDGFTPTDVLRHAAEANYQEMYRYFVENQLIREADDYPVFAFSKESIAFSLQMGAPLDGEPVRRLVYDLASDGFRNDLLEYLLQLGADPNAYYGNDGIPCLEAVYRGNIESLKLLLDYGLDLDKTLPFRQDRLFSLAAQTGCTAILELLLSYGAEINWQDSSGRTALMLTAGNGWYDSVELLLRHGADKTLRDKDGQIAKDYTKANHFRKTASLL